MKKLLVAACVVLGPSLGWAADAKPAAKARPAAPAPAASVSKQTPEPYQSYQQPYRDPKALIQARAQFEENERLRRMNSMRWYGLSNARPQASPDPFNGDYSPRWVSGDYLYPSRWSPRGSWIVVGPTAQR